MGFKDLIGILVPPADATEGQLLIWRVLMGFAVSGCILAIICLYIITAKADDINEIKAAIYPGTIQQLHRERCLTDSDYLQRQLAATIEDYQRKYAEATDGRLFPLESCDEIRKRIVEK